jgi:hypothetical protein
VNKTLVAVAKQVATVVLEHGAINHKGSVSLKEWCLSFHLTCFRLQIILRLYASSDARHKFRQEILSPLNRFAR